MMNPIEVINLSKSFGHIHALDKVSFSIERGELFGLIGPDGAGKSTLFNILVTLLHPDSGTALIDGCDLVKDYKKIRKIIGYLPGNFSLYGDLSCKENLEFFATLYGEDIQKNYSLIYPIWKQLLRFENRKASVLSGGMKQKLALCCALVHKPKILFLDEPTTGVDPVSRKELWDIFKSLKSENISVFVSTSYMEEATLCNRIGLIQNGKLLESNTPKQIQRNFQGYLIALQTNQVYQLLNELENFTAMKDYYAAGQHVNVVLNRSEDEINLRRFLEKSTVKINKINSIEPTIEDCFIQLMKENVDLV